MSKYEKLQEYLKNNKKSWLVTGAAGFIGSNLVEKLLELNQKVVALDNFDTGYQHNIDEALEDAKKAIGKDVSCNLNFIKGDIRELNDCMNACTGVDYVLHQAALGSVPRSIKDPIRTNKSNIDGFLNMLMASKDKKVKRFIYASSSSVYGDHPDLPKLEENIGKPLSPYATTKIVNEIYADVFAKTYGLQSIGLRYFNVFGKRQDPNGSYAAVIPKWVSAFLSQEEVFINGDGETSRDFCHVDNAVQMNLLAATTENNDAIDQAYNVALNDRTSLNQLYMMIKEKLLKHIGDLEKKSPTYKDFRTGDVRHSQANIDKSMTLLGYKPQYFISEGLDKAIDWYLANKI